MNIINPNAMAELEKFTIENNLQHVVRDEMIRTSTPVVEMPKRLFHATKSGSVGKILEEGLVAHELYGNVYFCEHPKHCVKFKGKGSIVFEIDTTQLELEKMYVSHDHNKKVFPFECYSYFGDIPSSAIKKNWKRY